MSDTISNTEALQQDLRRAHAALNSAREEIVALRAELARVKAMRW